MENSNRIMYNDVVFKLFLSTLIGNLLLKRIIYRLLICVEGVYLVYLLSSNHLYILNDEKKWKILKWNQNNKNCSLPCFNIIDFLSHSFTPFLPFYFPSFFFLAFTKHIKNCIHFLCVGMAKATATYKKTRTSSSIKKNGNFYQKNNTQHKNDFFMLCTYVWFLYIRARITQCRNVYNLYHIVKYTTTTRT